MHSASQSIHLSAGEFSNWCDDIESKHKYAIILLAPVLSWAIHDLIY